MRKIDMGRTPPPKYRGADAPDDRSALWSASADKPGSRGELPDKSGHGALWEAHRQRCLYCRKPLLFKELIIDHVIPETTANAERLVGLRITHALGMDFDILGDENLAPACHACNSDKLALLFSPERAALILTQVKGRLPKFRRLKVRYQEQASIENAMLSLSVALETGLMSPAELGDILRRHETGDPTVNLYQSLQFVGGVSVAALRRSEVDRLFDEPLALPGSQPLDVEHPDGRRREIRTTRQYRDAIAHGFVPTCNAMVGFATLFDLPLAAFTAMERAQPARVSFIREPRTGIIDLKYLPVSMLPKGQIFREDGGCETLEEVQSNGYLKVVSATSGVAVPPPSNFSLITSGCTVRKCPASMMFS